MIHINCHKFKFTPFLSSPLNKIFCIIEDIHLLSFFSIGEMATVYATIRIGEKLIEMDCGVNNNVGSFLRDFHEYDPSLTMLSLYQGEQKMKEDLNLNEFRGKTFCLRVGSENKATVCFD